MRKNDGTNFHYDNPIRLVNNGFAFCFKGARLSTTIGSDIEKKNKFCGQVSTIMKVISKKMVTYYINLVISRKTISQFLRDLLIYHLKLDLHHNKICYKTIILMLIEEKLKDFYIEEVSSDSAKVSKKVTKKSRFRLMFTTND